MGGFLPPAERRSGGLLALCAAVSLVLLLLGDHLPALSLRGIGAWAFSPLDRIVLATDRAAAAWRENGELHRRVAMLQVETTRLRVLAEDGARLRAELGLPASRPQGLRPVEILALSGEAWPLAATVSAGARDGAKVGDAVVTSDGLLGRIGEVYPTLSRVLLITDPNSAVACEVESTGVLGVLRFTLDPRPRLVLMNVPLTDTVRVGQRVVTSGLSQRYPRALPVGTVSAIGRDRGGLTQDVEVAPAARLSRLRHAFLLPHIDPGGGAP